MTTSAVARRRAERDDRLAEAGRWAHDVAARLPSLIAAVVVGSVARGDFNRWSDLDVLVVADSLPARWLDRCDALGPLPPGLQPIAWTPEELAERRRRRDPIAVEADTLGVTVWGRLPVGAEPPG